jgi:ribosomal protein S18 acetylase RimI-like enzyme
MRDDAATRIRTGHGDLGFFAPGDDWAVVAGVPCHHVALPHPWATVGRVLARSAPPAPVAVAEITAWLRAKSPQWTLMVAVGEPVDGYEVWDLLPALALRRPLPRRDPVGVEIGAALDRDEFLAVYGAELAPLVTEAHIGSARMHHLVARIDGRPVGCVRVRLMGDTAYVSAITVAGGHRGRGIGAALTVAATERAAGDSDLVWLHCTPESRRLYERLGYEHVDDHALLVST